MGWNRNWESANDDGVVLRRLCGVILQVLGVDEWRVILIVSLLSSL